MACDFHNGKSHRVEVSALTFAAGDSWDGAPMTAQCFRVSENGFTFEDVPQAEVISELNAEEEQMIIGGEHVIWSLSGNMDWDERDNVWLMALKDTPATTGASAPWTHEFILGNERYFGEIIGWHSTADGQTFISDTLDNCWCSSFRLTFEPNAGLMFEASGIAQTHVHDPAELALPSITATTPIKTGHITVLTLAGETDFRFGSFGLNINQPSTENEGYSAAAADSGELDYIDINAKREVTLDMQIRSREAVLTAIKAGTVVTGLIMTFNNAGAGAAEKELKIETGDLYIEKMPQDPAMLSRIIQEVTARALSQSGFGLKVTLKNANSAIPT